MKVSIITVAYNSAETINDCILSVLRQNYPHVEYIIVDGNSTDNTLAIIADHQEGIHKVISEPDDGIYHAMNKGIAACSGDVVGILNSDDVYADESVIADVVKLLTTSGAAACYGDLVYVNRNNLDKVQRTWISGAYQRENFLKGWMPPHPTFYLRREYYHQFGDFNLEFRTSADYELMLRMLFKNKLPVAYLNRTLVRMRAGGQSNLSLKNRLRANREDRRAWAVNGIKPPFWTTLRKPLSKISQFFKK